MVRPYNVRISAHASKSSSSARKLGDNCTSRRHRITFEGCAAQHQVGEALLDYPLDSKSMRVIFEPLVGYANSMCFKSVDRIPERMASAKRLMTSPASLPRI
jgi:hypothetical protein